MREHFIVWQDPWEDKKEKERTSKALGQEWAFEKRMVWHRHRGLMGVTLCCTVLWF